MTDPKPLPLPRPTSRDDTMHGVDYFTEADIRAHEAAVRAHAIERCARAVEEYAGRFDARTQNIARVIRALAAPEKP